MCARVYVWECVCVCVRVLMYVNGYYYPLVFSDYTINNN